MQRSHLVDECGRHCLFTHPFTVTYKPLQAFATKSNEVIIFYMFFSHKLNCVSEVPEKQFEHKHFNGSVSLDPNE